jgi:hypothetical protein
MCPGSDVRARVVSLPAQHALTPASVAVHVDSRLLESSSIARVDVLTAGGAEVFEPQDVRLGVTFDSDGLSAVPAKHVAALVLDWDLHVPLDLKSAYLSPSSGSFFPVDGHISMSEFCHSSFCVGMSAKLHLSTASDSSPPPLSWFGIVDTSIALTPVSPLFASVRASPCEDSHRFLQVSHDGD